MYGGQRKEKEKTLKGHYASAHNSGEKRQHGIVALHSEKGPVIKINDLPSDIPRVAHRNLPRDINWVGFTASLGSIAMHTCRSGLGVHGQIETFISTSSSPSEDEQKPSRP